MTAAERFPHRLTIVTGHYGTGKTEFSVNLALALAGGGERTALADLDIVDPYFRSRERRDLLEAAGVRLIASPQSCADADVPALPAELLSVLEDRTVRGVLDVGGDPSGARVLARWRARLLREDCQVLCLVNASRPEVRSAEGTVEYLRGIEAVTGLPCTGLVNNTHLCGETTAEVVRAGADLAEEVSRRTGIPVVCHAAEERLADQLADLPLFPIEIRMKRPWE
nr:hypothetical protein [uncultured Oscillibacter sp.]